MRTLLLAASLALPALALAQGALAPTGAPAPSMRSLDQIEPRTPLTDAIPGLNRGANGGFIIQNPGSYYLTGNLSVSFGDAITINSSGVTVDLGGFAVSSLLASTGGCGITTASGTSRITIRNGCITGGVASAANGFSGAGFLHGVFATGSNNVVVEGVTVQGLAGDGINLLGGSGLIRTCVARLCGGVGLRADQVVDSQARQCGATAIFAGTVPDDAQGQPVADGIATNCYGESLAGSPGVFATTATNCIGRSASGPGVSAKTATGCTGYSTYGCGLSAEEAANCHGKSERGTCGLNAVNTATGCTGEIVSATGAADTPANGAYGLSAAVAAHCRGTITANTGYCVTVGVHATCVTNCHGKASMGISCTTAQNSFGDGGVVGIMASGTASFCHGNGVVSAIIAGSAVACTAAAGSGPITAPNKQLGTP